VITPGIEPETSGSAARNSDHYTREAVSERIYDNITVISDLIASGVEVLLL
jgi:hypothetical protein